MLIGALHNLGSETIEFHTDRNNQFTNTKEELNKFAVCSNSPWSQAHETYEIKYNCRDAYTEKDSNEPDWKCTYEVVGYELITSIIYGYGVTQQESLQDCINMFERLQREFNKDDESF